MQMHGLMLTVDSFVVAIPAIAQRLVDDTDLPVYGADITDPKPDAVTFKLSTGLKIPLPGVSVKLIAFDLNLFNRDSDPEVNYLTVTVPEQTVKGDTDISVTSNDTPVLDEDEFVKSLTKAVYSKRFKLSAIGKTTAYIGALKAGITLDKDVELDGMSPVYFTFCAGNNLNRAGPAKRFLNRRGCPPPASLGRWLESARQSNPAEPLSRHICTGTYPSPHLVKYH